MRFTIRKTKAGAGGNRCRGCYSSARKRSLIHHAGLANIRRRSAAAGRRHVQDRIRDPLEVLSSGTAIKMAVQRHAVDIHLGVWRKHGPIEHVAVGAVQLLRAGVVDQDIVRSDAAAKVQIVEIKVRVIPDIEHNMLVRGAFNRKTVSPLRQREDFIAGAIQLPEQALIVSPLVGVICVPHSLASCWDIDPNAEMSQLSCELNPTMPPLTVPPVASVGKPANVT